MSDQDVKVGDVLDAKYRVERVLGAGGMGAVVLATHLDLDELRAVKYILPSGRGNAVHVERFLREARASIKLKSEHVVRVFDVGRFQSGEPYMVMEYLKGADLQEVLEAHGPLAPETAVDYLMQAMEAIAEAHRRGIIHRDLKPANLFLADTETGDRIVKVLDFGISKLTGEMAADKGIDMTKTSTMMGSPLFMSPEQMRSTKDVDHRTDIWSLGVIAFQLMSGQLPFLGESITALCAAVLTTQPQTLASPHGALDPRLVQAVMNCLAKDVDHRYQRVSDFATAIAPFGGPQTAYRLQRVLNQSAPHSTSGVHPHAGSGSAPAIVPATALPVPGAPYAETPVPQNQHADSSVAHPPQTSPTGPGLSQPGPAGTESASVSANAAAGSPAGQTAGAFSQSNAPNNAASSKRGPIVLGLGALALLAAAGLTYTNLFSGEGSTAPEGEKSTDSRRSATATPTTSAIRSTRAAASATGASTASSSPSTQQPTASAPSASASPPPPTEPKKRKAQGRPRTRRADPFGDGRH